MKKHLLALAGAAALGLATVASGPVSAATIKLAPGLGAVDSGVIQVVEKEREDGRRAGKFGTRVDGRGGARAQTGASVLSPGDFRSGTAPKVSHSADEGPRGQVQGQNVQRQGVSSSRNVDRGPRASGDHRAVRRGWSRDHKYAFYGAILVGVPFGYATYASHPCYDWLVGPEGVGYYWNYERCPV
ncbi:MAG: hypothetical protein WD871_06025 [Xanthobacteraceae bacterium]